MHLEACPGPGEKVLQHKLIQNMRRIFLAFDLAWDNISANDLSDNVLMKYSYSLRSDLHRLCLSRLGQIMGIPGYLGLGKKDLLYSVRLNFCQNKQKRSTLTPT